MQEIHKELTSGLDGKKQLLKGLEKSYNIIADTMGGRGNNNLFETISGIPLITSDGKDSLEQLSWQSPIENIALRILKEAVEKTFSVIGDGTTLTTVLTYNFFKNSITALENGAKEIELKEIIEKDVEKICEYIDSIATPCTDDLIFKVAKTSAHGDTEIAEIVAKAFKEAGEHGIVSHKRSMTDETYVKTIEGNPIESGYSHEGFVNVVENQTVVFDNPLVLCSLLHFQTINEVIPFLDYAGNNGRPLVIIANMEHDIENAILQNVRQHKYPFCVIKPPYVGKLWRETLSDIALVLGTTVLEGTAKVNYEGKETTYLGTCKRIEIGKKDTVIYMHDDADKSAIKGRIDEILSQIKHQTSASKKNSLKERISKLNGGISTIMVGGITPAETEERVARVDDAVCAVRSAKDGGVVAGGGMALYNAFLDLKLNEVTKNSIVSPLYKILENAGKSINDGVLTGSAKYPIGYDVLQYKEVNMIEEGIVDTAKGIKTALVNSASASNNLLRTNHIITFKRLENGK